MANDNEFEDFFVRLPSDPEEAFVVYRKKCADELDAKRSPNGWFYERQYVDRILAFDEVFDLGLFSSWAQSPIDDAEFAEFFWPFHRLTEKAALKFQLEQARRVSISSEGLVVLDSTARHAIHQLVDALRNELERLTLTEEKRSALFDRLNAFAREVDQNLTRTEALFRLAADIGRMAKDAGDVVKPAAERVDRLIDIVERAQKWAESLPPWGKRKEIPPPPKQIEGPAPSPDNETPF